MPGWEVFKEHLEGPLPNNLLKVLRLAEENGWTDSTSLVMRMSREQCIPFFLCWELRDGKYRFAGARVGIVREDFSGKLTLRDAMTYLKDPTVIEPERKKNVSPWRSAEGV